MVSRLRSKVLDGHSFITASLLRRLDLFQYPFSNTLSWTMMKSFVFESGCTAWAIRLKDAMFRMSIGVKDTAYVFYVTQGT